MEVYEAEDDDSRRRRQSIESVGGKARVDAVCPPVPPAIVGRV
jgi:hypothetical protein